MRDIGINASRGQARRAFTLVELLVVLAIIAVLVGFLLPTLGKARAQSMSVACLSNLSQIGKATMMYANDFSDRFPGRKTTGGHPFRRAPGDRTPGDPAALPETWGLAAVLHGIAGTDDIRDGLPKAKYIDGRSRVWTCPAASPFMQGFNNTYAFSIATRLDEPIYQTNPNGSRSIREYPWTSTKLRAKEKNQPWVWDNYNSRPGLTGLFGSPGSSTGFGLHHPHVINGTKRVLNQLWLDGHTDSRPLD